MPYRSLDRLDPAFRAKVESFLTDAAPIGIFITETWRSDEDQLKAFQAGTSFLDGKKHKSMHQLGKAIDIAFLGNELYPENMGKWRRVADIAKACGIDWGFDLWGWDKPHFQDNGYPVNVKPKPQISEWALDAVIKAKLKGMVKWDNPQEQIGTETMRAMLFKLKLVNREHGPITKEQMAVVLDRIGLLD